MNAPCKTIGLGSRSLALVRVALVFCLVLLLTPPLPAAVLTHRYPFDTNAADVIGGADGLLQGNAKITNGTVVFDGVNSGVQLPTNLFTNYDSITFELWYVELGGINGTAPYQSPLYEFSGSGGAINCFDWLGPGVGNYLTVGTNMQRTYCSWAPLSVTNHLVWTQDSNSQTACAYLNGALVGQTTNFSVTPALVGATTNDFLGHSFVHGSFFRGSISEFRVYQGALSPLEVAQSDAAGPDQPLASPGSLQAVRITLPASFGPGALLQPGVFADYSGLTNVNLITQPDLTLSSDNYGVLLVTSQQKIRTVGLGTAHVTAAYQGFSNTTTVMVGMPQGYALAHRYNFSETNTDWILHDSIGTANGRVTGFSPGPGKITPFNGSGQFGGTVGIPPAYISPLSELTVEFWVKGGGSAWSRICDFGSNFISQYVTGVPAATSGRSYFFITPQTDSISWPPYKSILRAAFTTNNNYNESPRLDWTNVLPFNVECQVAVTYSPPRGVAKLYLNGVPISSGAATAQLADIVDVNNWLGKSQFSADPVGFGNYDEFRIYSGFLQDSDIAADYAAGPNAIGTDFVLHSSVSGTNLTLSWGPAMANWILQSSPAVDPNASWSPVNTTTNFQNNRYSVTLPMSDASEIFRLMQEP